MRYRVEVAGKIFEGHDPRVLIKRAVQAKQALKRCDFKQLKDCTNMVQNGENLDFSRN